MATKNYQSEVASAIIAQNPQTVNETDSNGNTPLHGAALSLDAINIKLLLNHGAQFTQNENRQTPLEAAQQTLLFSKQPNFNRAALPKNFDPAESIRLLTQRCNDGSSSVAAAPGGPAIQ